MADKDKDKFSVSRNDLKDMIVDIMPKEEIKTEYVETGCVSFDMGISGGRGMPLGKALFFWGAPGCGKSTVLSDVIRRLITSHKAKGIPFKVAYVDTEGSWDLLKSMGLKEFVDSGDLLYKRGSVTFGFLENLYKCVLGGEKGFEDVKVIIIDSITGVLSDTLNTADVSKADFGSNAKERGRFYPKYLPECLEKGVTTLFISQVRQKQNASSYEDPIKAAVSDMDKHFMDVICKFSKKTGAQDKDMKKRVIKTAFGETEMQDRFKVTLSTSGPQEKNRLGRYPSVDMLVEYGKRVINAYTIREMLNGLGYIKIEGSKCKFSEELLIDVQGKHGLEASKDYKLKDANIFCKTFLPEIKDFLKLKGKYALAVAEEVEEDDGF